MFTQIRNHFLVKSAGCFTESKDETLEF